MFEINPFKVMATAAGAKYNRGTPSEKELAAQKIARVKPCGPGSTWTTYGVVEKERIVRRTSIRDRVVDAIGRASEYARGAKLPYTIAFSASEPHCIVRVLGFCRIETKRSNSLYAYYQVDGGTIRRMDYEKWFDLHHFMMTGESNDRVDAYTDENSDSDSEVADERQKDRNARYNN